MQVNLTNFVKKIYKKRYLVIPTKQRQCNFYYEPKKINRMKS